MLLVRGVGEIDHLTRGQEMLSFAIILLFIANRTHSTDPDNDGGRGLVLTGRAWEGGQWPEEEAAQ